MGSAVTMVEVETEMVWTGDMVKAEVLLSAIEGQDFADIELVTECDGEQAGLRIQVNGDDLREVREKVDYLLALLASAEAEYDSNN
tara:strand:+ start:5 stop:262 length:258 start_codon:yes stop_codon:yes gene_type:complete